MMSAPQATRQPVTLTDQPIAALRALHPGVLPTEITLPRAGLVIGRDPRSAGLVIRRDGVSRQHCWLGCLADGEWLVRDLDSRNGVYVNGQRVAGEQRLAAGDVIGLGRARLGDVELSINGHERRVTLSGDGPWRIGRDLGCDLSLPADPGVSQQHALVHLDGQRLRIEDRGSRNGTWHNGRRVRRARLQPGDEVFAAGSRLRLRSITPEIEFGIAAIEQALGVQARSLTTDVKADQGLDFAIAPARLQCLVMGDDRQRRAVLDALAGLSLPRGGSLDWSEPELNAARGRLRTRVGRVGARDVPVSAMPAGTWLEQQASLAAAGDLSDQPRRERVASLLARLDAAHLVDLPLDRLTALEQALTMVASELLTNPGLLLIDLSALLDQAADRTDLVDRLQALTGPRLTVVVAIDQPLQYLPGASQVAIEIGPAGSAKKQGSVRLRPRGFSATASMALLRGQLRGWRNQPLMLLETLLLPMLLIGGLLLALTEQTTAWTVTASLILAAALGAAFQVSRRPGRLLRTAQRHLLLDDALLAIFTAACLVAAIQTTLGLTVVALVIGSAFSFHLAVAAAAAALTGTALGLACGVAAGQRSDLALLLVAGLGAIVIVIDNLAPSETLSGRALMLLSPLPWAQALADWGTNSGHVLRAGLVLVGQITALVLAARHLLVRRL